MNFNAWMDSDYFWLYAILTVWFSIAAVLAYNESIEKHQKFVFFDFVALVLKKTVVVAFNILSHISQIDSKNEVKNSPKIITNVKMQHRSVVVISTYNNARSSFGIPNAQLVNWTSSSVTVRIPLGSRYVIRTMDPSGTTIDNYIES